MARQPAAGQIPANSAPKVVNSVARHGFTYTELVVVLLIMGVLATVARPRVADTLNRSRVSAAATRIAADLNLTRQSAISTSAGKTAQFVPVAGTYTLSGVESLDAPGQPYVLDLTLPPYHCEIVSADLGADTDVAFDFHGRPDSGGTVTVRAGNFQKTVTIDPDSGRAMVP